MDSNVLVRAYQGDDPSQGRRARELIERETRGGGRCFVSEVTLCELIWVLRSSYGISRKEIAEKVGLIVSADGFAFKNRDRVERALERFADGSGDFADYLVHEEALDHGCETMATFDKALLKEKGFRAP